MPQTEMLFSPVAVEDGIGSAESLTDKRFREAKEREAVRDQRASEVTARSDWAVKNVRTLDIGHEGGALTCTLWLDGKRVAEVEDEGMGGGYNYHFTDKDVEAKFYAEGQKFHGKFGTDCYLASFVDFYESMKIQRKFSRKGYPITVMIQKDVAGWSLKEDEDPYFHDTYYIAVRERKDVDALVKTEKAEAYTVYGATGLVSEVKYNG
jgi:hypothetical protein|tara:strand:- start:3521 stop:4144 length:624 start_codon:yes stop_codon:yes gene_type:complete